MTTTLRGTYPYGGAEIYTVVTTLRQQRLWYVVFIAPENDQPRVANTFKQMLDSVTPVGLRRVQDLSRRS